ncbi:portal protein [Methylocaldum sp.]|uniref:portal protein n=1 Tax=Methylocaldum sp. TaxID=1969727 RepID=UPI002D6D5A13|nr:portal protein [Methylocaldum sp.]HYE38218.1 portal protein [Methylocaldum sp.]
MADYTETDDTELLAKFTDWDKALDGHWGKWRREAREMYRFVSGEQWSAEDEAELKDKGRIAPVFNRVGPMIDAVSGAEISNRQQVQYFPREIGDSGVNEVLSKGAEYFRDECDAGVEESDAFRDALICGLGWTETRVDYEEDPEGKILVDRIDPLEVLADPIARKRNLADARYVRWRKPYSKSEFEALWGKDKWPEGREEAPVHHTDPRDAYEGDDQADANEVYVRCYQWYDTETVVLVEDPANPDVPLRVPVDEFDKLEEEAKAEGRVLNSTRVKQRRYRKAVVAGDTILEQGALPDGEFTLKCITGKRDRNRGVWYGLVKPMQDPQKWANQFFSQLLAILASSAKGGLIAERSVVDDVRTFEQDWAKHGSISWVQGGALQAGSIQPKPPAVVPPQIVPMMEFAIASIRDTTGVNQEMLGMVDRDQAGVLEHQRKQAAYGILADFFDSLRRYRKQQGRLLLKLMRYLDGQLIRIVGDNGDAQYVPLSMQPETAKYDVVVDEAPAGPNQKERVWSMIMQMTPLLKDMPPELWAKMVRYSPLPTALATDIAKFLSEPPEPDPAEEQMQQLTIADAQATVAEKQAGAQQKQAQAKLNFSKAISEIGQMYLAGMQGQQAATPGDPQQQF